MLVDKNLLKRTFVTGSTSGIAASIAAAALGKLETGATAAPANSTSHIVWGDEAARHDKASAKYTLSGFLINHAAALFWGAIYEKWVHPVVARWVTRRPELKPLAPLASAAVVSAGAYITDYYLVPKRLTPGYEKRLSPRSVGIIYGALAIGLAAGAVLARKSE